MDVPLTCFRGDLYPGSFQDDIDFDIKHHALEFVRESYQGFGGQFGSREVE